MEILIKSQNGEILINPKTIQVTDKGIFGARIIANNNEEMILGTYESLERAKEIIDEIFKLNKLTYIMKFDSLITPTKMEEIAEQYRTNFEEQFIPIMQGMNLFPVNPFNNCYEMPGK